MKARTAQILRDLFFITLALAILSDQLYVATTGGTVQPVLIFLVIFLFGCVPFLRGDKKREGQYGPFVRIIMAILGVSLPDNYRDAENAQGIPDKPSLKAGRAGSPAAGLGSHHGSTSAPQELSSQRSSTSQSKEKDADHSSTPRRDQ